MTATESQSNWARLFRIARALIRQVNVTESVIDRWTFGGGTAMMLQIQHRESHDVDIFLPDPQSENNGGQEVGIGALMGLAALME